MNSEQWNAKYPVGTPVRYWSVAGEPEHIDTKTRTPAWELCHGATVVSIEGKSGGVLVSHIRVLDQAESQS